MAHRISAAYYHGLDLNDKNQLALHKNECFNRRCWNPEHIYVGNYSNNIRDSLVLGIKNANREKTHCPFGHEYNKENTYINLDKERLCRTCRNEQQRALRAKRKLES